MKKIFVTIVLSPLMLVNCLHMEKTAGQVSPDTISVSVDSLLEDSDGIYGGFNEIRFKDFTDEDWVDNDYIRCLRQYITDYNEGKIEDEHLDPYKDKISGQFAVLSISPFMEGGAFIYIVFLDNPDYIFAAWVYSNVDEKTKNVLDYSVRKIKIDEENSELTKEDILEVIEEHPENKLW